ncbi:MAG: hypothetical protein G8237_09045, partial [Magnetococcales bacterium]|nr:hypothetical protein [Magnetococcales bacterium]
MRWGLKGIGVVVLGMLLTACGGGGSGSGGSRTSAVTTPSTTLQGVFQGSTVVGVHYRAELNGEVREGETDTRGRFEYLHSGSTFSPVTFSVGGVELGTVTPTGVTSGSYSMSVHDLVSPADPEVGTKVTNLQRFISTVNTSTVNDVIQVNAASRAALAQETLKLHEVAPHEFDARAQQLVQTLVNASAVPSGTTLLSSAAVAAHMQETKNQVDAARIATLTIQAGSDEVQADGQTRVMMRVRAARADGSALAGGLVRLETTAGTLGSESNLCDPATAVTSTLERLTDASGQVVVMLTPRCQVGTATVTATLGGMLARSTIDFVASQLLRTVTHTGVFQGYTLVGVHYRATLNGVIREGETDGEGRFEFLSDGESFSPVVFSVGGVVVGTMTPRVAMDNYPVTVHDLVTPTDGQAESRAVNIQRFLGSINTAANTGTVIRISAAERTALADQNLHLAGQSVGEFQGVAANLITTLIQAQALPAGTALLSASAVTQVLQDAKTRVDAIRFGTLTITSGAESVQADGTTRVMIQVRASGASENGFLSGGLVRFTTSVGTLGSETNLCTVGTQVTSSVERFTDSSGVATVTLTPRCQAATATVSASLGGRIVTTRVRFLPGVTHAANSSIQVVPTTLPADGNSRATVTVFLRDAHNNPVADKTPVTLLTDAGRVIFSSDETTSGIATFTLVAPNTEGVAHLSLGEQPTVTASVPILNDSATSREGVFHDLGLVGIHYRAELDGEVREGETDSEGRFRYIARGEVVSPVLFSVGGVVLGQWTPTVGVTGVQRISLHDLINPSDVDAEGKAINLLRFLQSIHTESDTGILETVQRVWRTLTSSQTTITITSGVRAALANESVRLHELPLSRFEERVTALVNVLIAAGQLPEGSAVVPASSVVERLRAVKQAVDGQRIGALELTVGADSVLADGRTRLLVRVHATTPAEADLAGGLVHVETTAGTLGAEADPCAANTIPTTAVDRLTDAAGQIHLFLTPRCQAATATITASLGGRVVTRTVEFTGTGATAVPVEYSGYWSGFLPQGIHYRAELNGVIREGETDAEGRFVFLASGQTISPVVFSVGGVVLGTITPAEALNHYRITVHDLVSQSALDSEGKVVNVQRFLSSLNSSGSVDTILINSAIRTALAGVNQNLRDLAVEQFDGWASSQIANLVNTGVLPVGSVLVPARGVTVGLREAKNQVDATRVSGLTLTAGAGSVLADGTTRIALRLVATSLSNRPLSGGWVHFVTSAGTLGNESNLCDANTTVEQSLDRFTDVSGAAVVMLTPRCQAETARVTASLGGRIVSTTVRFMPNVTAAVNSAIAVMPVSLPADGQATARVTVTLRDANNNPVQDETPVTLLTDLGTIRETTRTTVAGQATFTLVAPSTTGEAHLSLREYAGITGSVPITSPVVTDPATVREGVFHGIKLAGLHYRSVWHDQVQEGETDAEGRFRYLVSGNSVSPVTFSVGGVVLGVATPMATASDAGVYRMSLHDLVNPADTDAVTRITHVARLLATLDGARTDTLVALVQQAWRTLTGSGTTITILPEVRTALAGETVALHEMPVAHFEGRATRIVDTVIRAGLLPADTVLVAASEVIEALRAVKGEVDAGRVGTVELTVGAESVRADGETRVLVRVHATTLSGSHLVGGLVRFATTAGTLGSETNLCTDGTAITSTVDKMTDWQGMVYLFLTPRCVAATATVTAELGGRVETRSVTFVGSGPVVETTTYTGFFQGYRLEGVHYRAVLDGVVREGESDGEGRFQFLASGNRISPVTFSVGGVVLGTVTPGEALDHYWISLHDLVNPAERDAETKVINMQRFLSTINRSGNGTEMVISAAVRTALTGQNVNLATLPAEQFQTTIAGVVTTLIQANALPAGTIPVSSGAVTGLLREAKNQVDATRVSGLTLTAGAGSVLADGTTRIALRLVAT